MPLNSKLQVTMPEKGIIVRSKAPHYVYKVLDTFRNEKGQPTNSRCLIGRRDTETGMLIPNDKYYEFYDNATIEILESVDSIRSAGSSFLIGCILDDIGVTDLLADLFGSERAGAIKTAATYMACRGNVFEYVFDWCTGYTLSEQLLTSQTASSLFSSITYADRMSFFKSWAEANKHKSKYLVYDVTSFSSYAKGIEDTEWGYNRDGDKLAQINFGCYVCEDDGLPLFYVTYPGSIVDKSHLKFMMAYNDELGIKDTGFIMDRGFCTTNNIEYMHTAHYRYIAGVEIRHKATRAAIDVVRSGIVSMKNRADNNTYAGAVHGRYYGETSTMHVFYNPENAERQNQDLYRTVEAQEELLDQLAQITERDAKKHSAFFDINRNEDGTFTFSRSYDKIDEGSKNNGFFCLLTNTKTSSKEVLSIYRKKDVIEKGFDDLKNHIDMKRMHTHTGATTDGKMFCAFISLIVVSVITNKLRDIKIKKSLSKDSLISEMDKIKVVNVTQCRRLMNPLTKTQRLILEAYGISEDRLITYAATK
jgi:transposase